MSFAQLLSNEIALSLKKDLHPHYHIQCWREHVLMLQNTCTRTYSISCTRTTCRPGPLMFKSRETLIACILSLRANKNVGWSMHFGKS